MKFAHLIGGFSFLATAYSSTQVADNWIDIWSTADILARFVPPTSVTNPDGYFRNTTIRQTFLLTLAANQIRVKLSNEYGTSALEITTSTAALTAGNQSGVAGIEASTLQKITFGGQRSVTIPAGGTVVSDTLDFSTSVSEELTVSMYLAQGQIGKNTTSHDVAHTSTWFGPGDQTSSATITGDSSAPHWYYVTEVQALLPSTDGALICVGDSITDGTGSTMNGNNRWVNDLFRRTQANPATQNVTILNAGIGGNHLVTAGGQGPTALQRIKSVIAQPGVRYVTVLDGVNDIGHTATTAAAQDALYTQLVNALTEIITEVHNANLPIFGATLTPSFDDPSSNPDKSTYSNPERAATMAKLNTWIKNEAGFDYVVDYAAVLDDPSNPDQYQPKYAYTNYIHPNVAGHQAMADAWDLSVFAKFANGVPT